MFHVNVSSDDSDFSDRYDYVKSEDELMSFEDNYSNIDEWDEPLQFGDWKVITNPFDDQRDSAIYKPTFPYEFHPAIDIDCPKSTRECFEAFVSPKIVEFICHWTNDRAQIFLEENDNLAVKIHGLYWKSVSVKEMYVFISLILIMGLVNLPNIHDYWRKTYLLGGPPVFSADVMSRDRYVNLLLFCLVL